MITTERNILIAAHVTQGVKEAVRAEAKRAGLSMSEYVYVALIQKLKNDNVDILQYEADNTL